MCYYIKILEKVEFKLNLMHFKLNLEKSGGDLWKKVLKYFW